MYVRRLRKEFSVLDQHIPEGCSLAPKSFFEQNQWECIITGPVGSLYENGLYFIDIEFPNDYPLKPPIMKFQTKIYHPNIDKNGKICHPSLLDEWSPVFRIWEVLEIVIKLLAKPNFNSYILDHDIVHMYLNHQSQYEKIAKTWVDKYAK